MDVAILGTGEAGRRFARACLSGTVPSGPEAGSPDREPVGTVSEDDRDTADPGWIPAVTLYGSDATAVMDAVDALEDELRDRVDDVPAETLERVDGTTDLETAVRDADVAIETRSADLETVRRRLAGVEERLDRDAILGIHADVAGVTAAAAALERPGRAIGVSMVAPDVGTGESSPIVEGAGVIEVVRADQTDDATVDAVNRFIERLGWTTVVVTDVPGQVADRLALALEVEAMRAVEAGVASPAAIDAVVRAGFGQTVGPLERADRAGLDVRLAELDALAAELGGRFEPPAVLERKVQAGQLGVETGTGFREWDDDQPVDGDNSPEP